MRLATLVYGLETRTQNSASAIAGGVSNVADVAPETGLDVSPAGPVNHWYSIGPGPPPSTESMTLPPLAVEVSPGCVTMMG